jgi:hypothetical protein
MRREDEFQREEEQVEVEVEFSGRMSIETCDREVP